MRGPVISTASVIGANAASAAVFLSKGKAAAASV
jgi:hypothetical protein